MLESSLPLVERGRPRKSSLDLGEVAILRKKCVTYTIKYFVAGAPTSKQKPHLVSSAFPAEKKQIMNVKVIYRQFSHIIFWNNSLFSIPAINKLNIL